MDEKCDFCSSGRLIQESFYPMDFIYPSGEPYTTRVEVKREVLKCDECGEWCCTDCGKFVGWFFKRRFLCPDCCYLEGV